MSLNPGNSVIQYLSWHRKAVAVKPRKSENFENFKKKNVKNKLSEISSQLSKLCRQRGGPFRKSDELRTKRPKRPKQETSEKRRFVGLDRLGKKVSQPSQEVGREDGRTDENRIPARFGIYFKSNFTIFCDSCIINR